MASPGPIRKERTEQMNAGVLTAGQAPRYRAAGASHPRGSLYHVTATGPIAGQIADAMTPTDSTGDIQMDPRSASKHRGLAALRPPGERARTFAARRRGKASRPNLEGLEDRRLLSFSPAASYSVGTGPQSVVTADFNGDSRLDIVTADSWSGTVSVLLSKADGTFQSALTSAAGASPRSLAVGDFNADGKLDLAAASPDSVGVLLGKGDGTFLAPASVASFTDTDRRVRGRLQRRRQARPRRHVERCDPHLLWPLWRVPRLLRRQRQRAVGQRRGFVLAPGPTYQLGYGYHMSAVVEDFNGDGRHDFVSASTEDNVVTVLLANPDGSFAAPHPLPGRLSLDAGLGGCQRRRQARPGDHESQLRERRRAAGRRPGSIRGRP